MTSVFKCALLMGLVFAGLATAAPSPAYPATLYDATQLITPISRRVDFTMVKHGFVGSNHRRHLFLAGEDNLLRLRCESTNGDNSGWTVWRFAWTKRDITPCGVRLEIRSSATPVQLGFELHTGFVRNQAEFYGTKQLNHFQRKLQAKLQNGDWQVVEVRWDQLGIPAREAQSINGVGIVFPKGITLPFQLELRKVSLLFSKEESARRWSALEEQQFYRGQDSSATAMQALGVDMSLFRRSKDYTQREKLLWGAVELLAQRNQLRWYNELNRLHNGECHPEWLLENQRMIDDYGVHGDGGGRRQQMLQLQSQVDKWIDRTLSAVPAESRRWRIGEDGRFVSPLNQPWRMYSPFFFRGIYEADSPWSWRKADMRYLAALGFTGIRLCVYWRNLEPTPGKLDAKTLDRHYAILKEAERYGLAASFDLHWPYPGWFNAGQNPAWNKGGRDHHNSYHWMTATVNAWRQIGQAFAHIPNIAAFEIPSNETPIANDPKGIKAFPELQAEWNRWLKDEYGSDQAIDAVWRAAAQNGQRYGLQPGESLAAGNILPMGFQGEESPAVAAAENPRYYDFLRWAAWMQERMTGEISNALRESIPEAVCMFQRTIGDMWDKSPVPINYRAILTSVHPDVLPGTHYDMGGLQVRKAVAIAPATYDSEQQMEGSEGAVKAHVELGAGFCPFAFHAIGGGGMLFSDNDWHLKPQVLHLMRNSDFIRSYWPKPYGGRTGPRVGIITSARAEAADKQLIGDLITMLEGKNCRVSVLESLRILQEPHRLHDLDAIVVPGDYMDLLLLELLIAQSNAPVLFHGRLSHDAYSRNAQEGLPGALVRHGLFIKDPAMRSIDSNAGVMDLSGSWEWKAAGTDFTRPMAPPPPNDKSGWTLRNVPGQWGELGLTGSLHYYIGDAWQRTTFTLPEGWQDSALTLKIGAIDDLDWVWVNGKLIGHTGMEVQDYWTIPREYPIPKECLNPPGKPNVLVVGVRNLRNDGGIWRGPVVISREVTLKLTFQEDKSRQHSVALNGNASCVEFQQLLPEATVVATLGESSGNAFAPAVLRQDRFWWYVKNTPWNGKSTVDSQILERFLKALPTAK